MIPFYTVTSYRYWENAISAYTGNDPLELWFDYICWYEQNVALDTDNKMEAILGKCLSIYEYSENFNQDLRLVKLWLKYVSISLTLYELRVGCSPENTSEYFASSIKTQSQIKIFWIFFTNFISRCLFQYFRIVLVTGKLLYLCVGVKVQNLLYFCLLR